MPPFRVAVESVDTLRGCCERFKRFRFVRIGIVVLVDVDINGGGTVGVAACVLC
jgi:hypothetical protein